MTFPPEPSPGGALDFGLDHDSSTGITRASRGVFNDYGKIYTFEPGQPVRTITLPFVVTDLVAVPIPVPSLAAVGIGLGMLGVRRRRP